jgi:glycosyltransferase involved in cell wall biosynthesis
MKIVHRFYDLFVGGAEVVVLNTVKALPDAEHLLLFSRSTDNWIRSELSQLPNVRMKQIEPRESRNLGAIDADLFCFHFYPPMGEVDFRDLPSKVLKRSILVNHWYKELPFIGGLRYIFLSEESRQRTGASIPKRFSRVLINPVADSFFRVDRVEVPNSVGRHSRDAEFKFSDDFFDLHESISSGKLSVFVLGAPNSLQEFAASNLSRLKNHYWLLNMSSLRVPVFLKLPQVYLYKTRDDFAETCPMNILEAMAAGIPIVAERKGGVSSLLTNNVTGILCNSLQEHIDSTTRLLENTALRTEIGSAAKEWAFENASIEKYGLKFVTAVGELLAS